MVERDKAIIECVIAETGITLEMMRSRVMVRRFVDARMVLAVLLMTKAGLVQREIAEILNRNKACIYYYREHFDDLILFDDRFAVMYRKCLASVEARLGGEQ